MKNIKNQELISQGWDNNWLTLSDMETAEERTVFEQLMLRNELNIYCDTLVSVDTQSIRQDAMKIALDSPKRLFLLDTGSYVQIRGEEAFVNGESVRWDRTHQRDRFYFFNEEGIEIGFTEGDELFPGVDQLDEF
ncbi:MAG: hypothetical protein KKC03_13045 [Bacteroidetes bacterium]|nr:hypothetical protein [Bacteroidota bacterium]